MTIYALMTPLWLLLWENTQKELRWKHEDPLRSHCDIIEERCLWLGAGWWLWRWREVVRFRCIMKLLWISRELGTVTMDFQWIGHVYKVGLDFRDHLDLFWGQVGNINAWSELHGPRGFEKQDAVPYHIKKIETPCEPNEMHLHNWPVNFQTASSNSQVLYLLMRDQGPRKIIDCPSSLRAK